MKIIEWFKDESKLINENEKIKKSKKIVEGNYNKLIEKNNELAEKYIELLEQKSEQIDLYLKYQDQCETLIKEKKDLKKQLAESIEIRNTLINSQKELEETIAKLERKIKRLEKQNESIKQ